MKGSMKNVGRNNRAELIRKTLRWFSYVMASLFIVVGTGILTGLLLPGHFPITSKKRLIFGGIILLYGIARMITLFLKRKKEKVPVETINKE